MTGIKNAHIREEQAGEEAAVFAVERVAFGRELEAKIVDRLRADGAAILSLVAEVDGRLVGHALYSAVRLVDGDEMETAVALGPIGVHPDWQNRGIGGALIKAGHDLLRQRGHNFVFVLGHAGYYPKFGFHSTAPCGIRPEFDVPENVFMVAELVPGALGNRRGTVVYHDAFK